MKAVILAAGEGSRLHEEGEPLPKPLVRLGGLALLERMIRNAAKAGATEFVVVVGHRGDEVIATLTSRLREFSLQWVQHSDWRLGNALRCSPHALSSTMSRFSY